MTDEYHDRVNELRDNYAALTDLQKKLVGSDMCGAIEGTPMKFEGPSDEEGVDRFKEEIVLWITKK